MTDYDLLNQQLDALTKDVLHPVANLANAAALLWEALHDINWAGSYLLKGDILTLGPFQGKVACVEIPVGKGVCGAAVLQNKTQLVPNVHNFPGHIACDCASNSEIVIPLRNNGEIIGVLDIDSPIIDRFTEADRAGLEGFAQILQSRINGLR